jgi:hypothetical protein
MARLSSFKIDSKAREQGEWVSPGDEYGNLEILTRGFTDSYTDARAAKVRRAAMQFGGDASKIPSAVSRAISVDCMIAHVLLGVRGLEDDTGQPVEFAAFVGLLRDPDYGDLFVAAVRAASMVGMRKVADINDALGN